LGSVLNNFAVGIYSKYGGTPWRIKDPKFSNTMVIGISSHYIRPTRFDAPEKTIFGFSEIVDQYGHHIDMTINPLTLKASEFKDLFDRRSLFMPKELAQELIDKSIEKIKRKTNNLVPQKIIINKTSPYHQQELEGIKAGLSNSDYSGEYALIHMMNETGYRTYRETDYQSLRGLLLKPYPTDNYGVLWTVGKIPAKYYDKREGRMKFYEKGGPRIGTASPIGISIHQESNLQEIDLNYLAEQTLGLTKMRYSTVDQATREPVSTYFARKGGRFIADIWNNNGQEIDVLMENIDARFLL
jgi:hypothetical protein